MFNSHFSTKTIKSLTRKGIAIIGLTLIPGEGDMPYANGETGYCLDNNGEGQVRTFLQVLEMAK